MKLDLLIAPSGFGKTHFILNDIEKTRKDSKIIVLTPEQNSFNFEKMLCDKFGGTFNIDVMNFTTLTKNLSKKISLENIKNISDDIKPFYFYKAAKNLEKTDNFLVKRILQDTSFISVVEDILKELKEYRVSINILEDYLEKNSNLEQAHREKLEAILELYVEYSAVLKLNESLDKEDYINEFLLYMDYVDLSDHVFYIDAYYNFTAQEYSYIEKIIKKAKKVVFSIISDANRYFNIELLQLVSGYELENIKYEKFYLANLHSEEKYKLDIFRKSHEIVASLNEIMRRNNELKVKVLAFVEKEKIYTLELELENDIVKKYKILSEHSSRFEKEANFALATQYYKVFKSSAVQDDSVEIICAKNKELEVKEVAREILKLKEQKEILNSEIAILYRDDVYENYEYVFKDYNLDIHLDKDVEVKNHRLIKFITEILAFNNNDFKNSLMNIFKTNLTNFENIYRQKFIGKILFENSKLTKKQLVENFNALKESEVCEKLKVFELENHKDLEEILKNMRAISVSTLENILTKKIVRSLDDVNSEIFIEEDKKISSFELEICQEIITEFVTKINEIHENFEVQVKNLIKKLENIFDYCNIRMYLDKEDGEYDDIEELKVDSIDRQVYKKTLELLNNILKNFGREKMDYNKFVSLLKIGLESIKYRSIPEINEAIIMSTMDLAKVENKKIIFVLGFNKDVLPKSKKTGLLYDSDKESFFSEGIYLSPKTQATLIDEEFVAYIALSRAREKTYISYSLLDKSYKENFPSPYLNTVKALLPKIKERTTSKILEFNLANYSYYYDNMNEILTTKEYTYLFLKIYRRYLEVRASNTKEERMLEKLLERFLEGYVLQVDNIDQEHYYLETQLNDRVYFSKDITVKNYLDKIIRKYKFELSDENIQAFLAKEGEKFGHFSSSKIADYQKNPYIFFIKRILNIQEEGEIDIDSLVLGKFSHAIMADSRIIDFIKDCGEKINEDEDALEKFDVRKKVLEVVYNNDHADIKEMLSLIKLLNTHNYILEQAITRLTLAVAVEIKYYSIMKYMPTFLEKYFALEITKSEISCRSLVDKNKVITKKFKKEYNIPNIKFVGVIDRVDTSEKNVLIVDYKSSKTDFSLTELELGQISQILTYALACELMFDKKSEDLFGVFYREIARLGKNLKEFRLRGVANKDLVLNGDYLTEIPAAMYLRVTQKGKIHASDAYRAYSSPELEFLISKNLHNILTTLEEIYTFSYSFDKFDVEDALLTEKQSLFNYATSSNTSLKEKEREKISTKDLQKKILDEMN